LHVEQSSGAEISRDVNRVAKRVYQSIRPPSTTGPEDPLRIINRSRIPKNTTVVGEIRRFLPLRQVDGGIAGGDIELSNGTVISGIDHIIFATGFLYSYPFLPRYHNISLKFDEYPASHEIQPIVTDGTHLRSLYLDLFYIDDPTLGFICMNHAIGSFTLAGYEANVLAKVWGNEARIPSRDRMWALHRYRIKEAGGYSKWFSYLGSDKMTEMLRFFVAWLNEDARKFGGSQIDIPPERSLDIGLAWQVIRSGGQNLFETTSIASGSSSFETFVDA